MDGHIAVFLGKNGETTSIYEKGLVRIFQREKGKWHITGEKEFSLESIKGLREMRERMEELLSYLHDCKIFAGRSITGLPYFILEKANFSLWECEGKPVDFLDHILVSEELIKKKKNKKKDKAKIDIIQTGPGDYYISLKEIQGKNSPVTSKQLLLPFIRKGDFNTLEVVCNHVPLWLEGELLSGDYSKEIFEMGKNELKVIITRN